MKTAKQLRKDLAVRKAQVTRIENKLAAMEQAKADKAKAREVKLTEADKAPLQFGLYTDKVLVVWGGTKSRLDRIMELKNKGLCTFNPALKIGKGGKKDDTAKAQGGWLFFTSKTPDTKALKAYFN